MTRRRALAALVVAPLFAGGCAAPQSAALKRAAGGTARPDPVRLAGVPFFPQRDYECGPAALAMAMTHAGVPVAPEALVPEVWIPARRGALQAEMLAAPTRRGLLATRLRDGLDAPLETVAGGVPAIVFQNLGLSFAPVWHYAVLIGYDLAAETVLLHTGVDEAASHSLHVFERTWVRGGSWAMAVTPPQRLPAGADQDSLLRAAAALERIAPAAASQTWQALFERFPDNRIVLLGRGNSAWALGRRAEARAAWQHAVERHPDFADAWNNLAYALSEAGETERAREAAQRAVALGGPRIHAYRETLGRIEETRGRIEETRGRIEEMHGRIEETRRRMVIPSGQSPKLPMP